jgi:hypothetical protein
MAPLGSVLPIKCLFCAFSQKTNTFYGYAKRGASKAEHGSIDIIGLMVINRVNKAQR